MARASLQLRSQGRLCPWVPIMGVTPMLLYADREIGVPGRANRAKQSQTWANWGIWGTACRRRPGSPRAKCAKRSQLRRSLMFKVRSVKCKTNPILRSRTSDCGLGTALRSVALARPNVQNEPNSPPGRGQRDGGCGAKCAKRTLFPVRRVPGGRPIVRNEANSEGCRAGTPNPQGADCAKRTQFAVSFRCRASSRASVYYGCHAARDGQQA